MSFIETVRRARVLLREEGPITLRGLKREFDLDDEALEELIEELVEGQQVAAREGKVLSWLGPAAEPQARSTASSPASEPTSVPEGERRQLTVLFCDLVDSTRLAAGLDPEDWCEVVRGYQESAAAVIEHFGGHVAQYLGDGLLVYFGDPRAHEDDAERAVRAGIGIVEAVGAGNEARVANHRIEIAVRVGIHTGPVVVGEMGSGASRERLAMGNTTNVAARLQAIAEPDTVVLSPSTLRLVRGIFVTVDLGARMLKGLAEPLVVHRVQQGSGVRSRLDLDNGKLTPFVGRQQELGMLLDAWDHVCEGEGETVLVIGEAGVGKSRLVRALRDRLLEEDHTWLECHCSPHTQNSALQPVIELVSQGLAFQEDESAGSRLRKLERGLSRAGLDLDDAVPLFAPLISIPRPERYETLQMSPELQRHRTLEALVAWTLALADLQPVLLLMEDLHWCDPSTLELLELLIEQCPTARVLTVLTARPEFEPPSLPHSHWSSVTLNRLLRRRARQMAASLSADRPLPEEALEAIVDRADGIPLYIEELTKAVLESELLLEREGRYEFKGALAELAIPATLKDSLMSRLDRLPEAKHIAQTAAALGRDFSYRLLAAVAHQDEPTLREGLTRLSKAEILLQRGVAPNADYAFRHALIRDTAYESLLKSTRQDLHGRIADTLERDFPDRAAAEPELLAYHYDRAGRNGEAIHYYQRAGDVARARSASAEAIANLTRGLELARELPKKTARIQRELALQLSLGPVLEAVHGYASNEARGAWERACELGEECGNPEQLFVALYGLATISNAAPDLDAVIRISDRLLAIARSTNDEAQLVAAHQRAGMPRFYKGLFSECVDLSNAAATIYDPKQHRPLAVTYGTDQGTLANLYAALALGFLGYADQAGSRLDAVLIHARGLAHPHSLATALTMTSVFHAAQLRWESCARIAGEGREVCERHGFPLFLAGSKLMHALAVARLRGEDTLAEAAAGLAGMAETGTGAGAPLALWALGGIHQEQGRVTDALGAVEAGLATSARTKQGFFDAELLRSKGELVLSRDEAEAESLFLRAVEIARSQEARSLELRAVNSLARLWQRQGKPDEARELLQPIYDWFSEGFDTQDLKDAKALLEELR